AVIPLIHLNELFFALIVLLLAFGSSFLLVSNLPMFSLKVKSLKWKGNELRYLLVVGTVVFISLWGFLGIAGAILLYIILSIFNKQR
ncbi:CDP-diacylglycerol--serine O-phosphatidyltransferase, partial [Parabacteroides sp. OttesenSCG-928-G21]|nr:CDP-diacylglycerol--serine O-phosphatidyltransferase [Parabacteroides sp. OttesenSCG-928-G21]